nr:MAG TPA: Protein of unknown function (DUF1804) [Caudoviricetes sp.]
MAADWLKIRNDYINGGGSYRKLAEKYGVSFDTLQDKAKREEWKKQKENQHDKITTKSRQKTAEKTAVAISDEAVIKIRIRAKLLKLAEKWLDSIEDIEDTGDFRRIVQSCCDLGITIDDGQNARDAENNLFEAINSIGEEGFDDLPELQQTAENGPAVVEDEKVPE